MTDKISILTKPLSEIEVKSIIDNPRVGAQVYFIGTVRSITKSRKVDHLNFSAYVPMALKEMAKIRSYVLNKYEILDSVIVHRIGRIEIGETAVIIGISAMHRKDAFMACQYAIDTLKETVPIWKKEVFIDGEIWVSAHP